MRPVARSAAASVAGNLLRGWLFQGLDVTAKRSPTMGKGLILWMLGVPGILVLGLLFFNLI